MLKYSWPGNIRELRNAVELLCLLREGKQARVVDLPRAIQSVAQTSKATPPPSVGSQDVIPIRLDQPLEGSIASILSAALDREGGNRSRAARRLSISLRTMQRHAARLSLPPDR
jgi:DNA-binding NtrC family response regulator